MKKRYIILTFILSICFTGFAQEGNMQQNIAEYLSINGTERQYNSAYDQMFDVLKQQFNNANVPADVWSNLQAEKSKKVDQIVILLASAYRKHFNEGDIIEMLKFYKTDTGKKLAGDPTSLNKEENKEAALFYGSDTGKKITQVTEGLSKDISQISEYWSRDLFKETMNKLIAMGYNPQ